MGLFEKIKLRLLNSSDSYKYYEEQYDISQRKIKELEEKQLELSSKLQEQENISSNQQNKELQPLLEKQDNLLLNLEKIKELEEKQLELTSKLQEQENISSNQQNKELQPLLEKQDILLSNLEKLDSIQSQINCLNDNYANLMMKESLFHENTVSLIKENSLKTSELKFQFDDLNLKNEKTNQMYYDNIFNILKNFDYRLINNDEDFEMLNKSVNLVHLSAEEILSKIDKKDDDFEKEIHVLIDDLNNLKNFVEYSVFYQKYSNRNSKLMIQDKDNEKYIENIFYPTDDKNYLISIIIPLYNIEKSFLMRAFNSITRQTIGFENLEVIFIDDKSSFKEGTYFARELTEMYSNVKLLTLDHNVGTGQARNFGLNNSNGKYIMFLDQDDVYLPDSCEILYNAIIRNDSDMVCGNYINISRDGYDKVDWSLFNIEEYLIETENVTEHMELFEVDPSIWAKIFSKKFIQDNKLQFCEYRGGDDLLFYHEALFKAKSVVNINEPIVVYEQRTNKNMDKISFSLNNSFDALKDLMEIYVIDFELFKKYNDDYLEIPLDKLNYFVVRRLKYSSLTFEEYNELIMLGKELFVNFVNKEMEVVPYFRKMFEYIVKEDIENAYLEYKQIIKG